MISLARKDNATNFIPILLLTYGTMICKIKIHMNQKIRQEIGLRERDTQTIDQAHFLCKEEHFHHRLVVQTGGKSHDRVLSNILLNLLHTTHALQLQHLLKTGKGIPGAHELSKVAKEHAPPSIPVNAIQIHTCH